MPAARSHFDPTEIRESVSAGPPYRPSRFFAWAQLLLHALTVGLVGVIVFLLGGRFWDGPGGQNPAPVTDPGAGGAEKSGAQAKATDKAQEKPSTDKPGPTASGGPGKGDGNPPAAVVSQLAALVDRLQALLNQQAELLKTQGHGQPGMDPKRMEGIEQNAKRVVELFTDFEPSLKRRLDSNDRTMNELAERLKKLEALGQQHFNQAAAQTDVMIVALMSKKLDIGKYSAAFRDLFEDQTFSYGYRNYRLGFCLARGESLTELVPLRVDETQRPKIDFTKFNQFGVPGNSTELLADLKIREKFGADPKRSQRRCIVVASSQCLPPLTKEKEEPWRDLNVDAILLATEVASGGDAAEGGAAAANPDVLKSWLDFCRRHHGCVATLDANPKTDAKTVIQELKTYLRRLAHPQLIVEK
jgi:hypothetical protein